MKPTTLLFAAMSALFWLPSAAQAQQQAPARSGAAPAQPAAKPAAAPAKARGGAPGSPFGGMGGDSKEPIKIDADKLDVLDKDNKAIFSGNVVAVQGETTVRCSTMTVFYEGRGQNGAGKRTAPAPAPAAGAAPSSNDGAIKRIECAGPVTVVSKTQAATSDNAVFDRANNKVIMTGNVALNDGPNITRGERLVYDTQTGIANVDTKPGGRVQGFFVPNSAEAGKEKPGAAAKPATPTN
ncbi:LptA/OstA family protein [Bosea sp. (in: a-proteobacteria)]|jgi:lipopolysaccharide export system protein LptA|uniref:LptA/OstA family protein n=1 Tax=Bosea sp. (in: a-proteobacteria) TaxID=1871050 RepID=UPI0025BE8603|nr:LptA/OstA family protein [Bosea sp. (in: a-proteobacteria)]